MWGKLLRAIAKYGFKAVRYAIKHRKTIIKILKEVGIQAAIAYILDHI
ncbi:aureocin A53 family class IId bacteriocin [Clostridium sp. E02]|nr:aureocin A53 family class IId bacteriocin [Clostridium sp. E02]